MSDEWLKSRSVPAHLCAKLSTSRLWKRSRRGRVSGYVLRDYLTYNRSKQAILEHREKDRVRKESVRSPSGIPLQSRYREDKPPYPPSGDNTKPAFHECPVDGCSISCRSSSDLDAHLETFHNVIPLRAEETA